MERLLETQKYINVAYMYRKQVYTFCNTGFVFDRSYNVCNFKTLKLRLHIAISYLGACLIRTKVTTCIREKKMALYFRDLTIKSHLSAYKIGPINRSV